MPDSQRLSRNERWVGEQARPMAGTRSGNQSVVAATDKEEARPPTACSRGLAMIVLAYLLLAVIVLYVLFGSGRSGGGHTPPKARHGRPIPPPPPPRPPRRKP